MKRSSAAAMFGAILLLASCQDRLAVWILPSVAAGEVRFGVGRSAGKFGGVSRIAIVRVDAVGCDPPDQSSHTAWLAVAIAGEGTPPDSTIVEYGKPWSGFRTESGPEPLSAGCYHLYLVGAAGRGMLDFAVDSQGKATLLRAR